MRILITGSKGFVGRNLVAELKNRGYKDILEFDINTKQNLLDEYTQVCDFVFHLVGVNRPESESEFMKGNYGFTSNLLTLLRKHNNLAPILFTSTIQAARDNPYGISKKAGENLIFEYNKDTGSKVLVYRLPNLFGKWSKPNYNSVVATFCYNVARGIPIEVHDPDVELTLCYIDDVLDEFIRALEGKPSKVDIFYKVPITHNVKLRCLADTIKSFHSSREDLYLPDVGRPFINKLYSTYLSYLPEDQFAYALTMHVDERGAFTEILRSNPSGQVSVNVSKPGIIKGNHWHRTKAEKFLVVSGEGLIRLREIGSEQIIEYKVSDSNLEVVVDIPPGYVHVIINTGNVDMVTIMWANECYDPENPDTHFLEV